MRTGFSPTYARASLFRDPKNSNVPGRIVVVRSRVQIGKMFCSLLPVEWP